MVARGRDPVTVLHVAGYVALGLGCGYVGHLIGLLLAGEL
jgi:hypothetical protein